MIDWVKKKYNDMNKKDECKFNSAFGVIIHRFNLGSITCACGEKRIKEFEQSKGWKKQKQYNVQSKNN